MCNFSINISESFEALIVVGVAEDPSVMNIPAIIYFDSYGMFMICGFQYRL
jgi:hypothetical protein